MLHHNHFPPSFTIVALIWALGWTAQETTVVLHLNKVWGLNPHQAEIAFIAAIVPTIFCESNVPPFSP